MALDEATTTFLSQMAESGMPPIHEMTPEQARDLGGMLRDMYGPGPEVERVDEHPVPVPDGSVPVRVLTPPGAPRGVLVYYHGGGWVIGAPDEFDTLARHLAVRTACVVALVDYRLAPEHRYPVAVDDSWAALCWVDEHVERLAGARVPVLVAGDSAGGNLAAVLTRRARDGGAPEIAMQVLVYPVTDADLGTDSYVDPANQLMLSRDSMIWFWDHYAPDERVRAQPDAAPLRVADLSGLPPAVVLTAEHDPVRDEGEAYASRLADAGVDVALRRFDGQMHGFFQMVNVLPGSDDGVDYVVEAVNRQLAAVPR